MRKLKKVRFGIIGAGMGGGHAAAILEDRHRDFCLSAVCDVAQDRAARLGEKCQVPYFTDAREMYRSGLIDAVLIATPHYFHPALAIRAARAGIHVLCEKPLAVTIGPARLMVEECRKHKVAFGAMLQHRTRRMVKTIKRMVDAGELGEVFRVSMICSNWYRTQAYYESGAWRGTWDGEGGGILLNQAPHSLDAFQWIAGMPRRVIAHLATRWHKIEVENVANVICDYGDGKVGTIYATTAELPGMEQLTVSGDKGTLVAQDGVVRFARLKTPITRHLRTSKDNTMVHDGQWKQIVSEPGFYGLHIDVIRAFAANVLRGEPMIATGKDGLNELELSNAIYLAGFSEKPVDLPVDAKAIDRLIDRLVREHSTGRGQGLRRTCQRELARLMKE